MIIYHTSYCTVHFTVGHITVVHITAARSHLKICYCSYAGGTLRIYADSLKPNIPYKTILLSTRDTADFAVVEALEKYGLEKENPREYCIARVTITISLTANGVFTLCGGACPSIIIIIIII